LELGSLGERGLRAGVYAGPEVEAGVYAREVWGWEFKGEESSEQGGSKHEAFPGFFIAEIGGFSTFVILSSRFNSEEQILSLRVGI
jgi:hypothetical protein